MNLKGDKIRTLIFSAALPNCTIFLNTRSNITAKQANSVVFWTQNCLESFIKKKRLNFNNSNQLVQCSFISSKVANINEKC